MRKSILSAFFLLVPLAHAGEAPSPQEIIDALTPKAEAPMRTRSLRNLFVRQADSPAGASEPAAAPAQEAPPSISMSINFEFASARLSQDSIGSLGNLSAALASPQLREMRFRIEGHTDAKGGAAYNLKLSSERAEAVKSWLARHGVQPQRLDTVGLGSSQPADPDPLAAANRRVRIVTIQ